MMAEVSINLDYSYYGNLEPSTTFSVRNVESNSVDESCKRQVPSNCLVEDNDSNALDKDGRRMSIQETDDTVGDLDLHEIEQRHREANEETTRSEDLRKFLVEMHETLGKSNKVPPLDNSFCNNKTQLSCSSPVSANKTVSSNPQLFTDISPMKQMIDPNQEGDLQAMAAETAPMGPPDGGWAWLIVLASFFCMITIDGTCFNYGLLVPDMTQSFDTTNMMDYMWPGSLIAGFYMSLGPVASALSNQFNFRPVAMAGGFISGLALLLSTFMNNFFAFILFFGIFGGIGFSLIYLPAIAVVGHWFHEKRPIAVGLALCGSGFGTLLFGQLIPTLIDVFTWKGTVVLIAAVSLQSTVFIALFRPLELHLRMKQLSKIRHTIRQIRKEEHERKRLEHEKQLEEEKKRKKAEKEQLRQQQRMKNKRIVIYRGSIMQKIIEEKKRQRTVSMGSLDGMVITRDNELVKVAMSSIDIYEKPILSVNAINKIKESVVKRLESKLNKNGPAGVVTLTTSASNAGINTAISNAQIKNSLPQLVQEYINSQISLQVLNNQAVCNGSTNINMCIQQQAIAQVTNVKSDDSLKTGLVNGLVLEEKAKAVIQASLRKEMTRPFHQKELLFTGSLRQLSNEGSDIEKRSQVSLNFNNACNNSIHSQHSGGVNESTNPSIVEDSNHVGVSGDGETNQFVVDTIQTNPMNQNEGPFRTFMRELLDINLLSSPTFLVMVISSITAMLGIFVPFYLLPGYITSLNMNLNIAGQLISYVGIANTAGRLFATIYIEKAWSSNYPWADCLWINNVALILAGLTACFVPFCITNYAVLVVILVLYGLCVAAFVSLKSILVVELLGLNRLTNAFGFLLIFQGLATVFGPPLAGLIYDLTAKKYENAFYFAGLAIIVSGFLCFPLRSVAKLERKCFDQQYGPIILDEENSLGDPSYMEMNGDLTKEGLETSNNSSNNSQINSKDEIVEKAPVNQEFIEISDEAILEPVAEEEEEDEDESHTKSHVTKTELFEVKKVE